MKSSFKHIILGAIAFVMTIIIAVTGYILAGWSLLDAVYMSVSAIRSGRYCYRHGTHRGDIPQFARNYVLKRDVRYRGSYRRPQP